MNIIRSNTAQMLALAALCYFIIFHKMGAHSMRLWDESYFAVHSYEMLQQNSWLASYFNGELDWRGSKPPLQNWLQMICISIMGMSEVAVRLPTALAATAAVFITFLFLRKETNTHQAWIGALILLSSVGFIWFHTARTGDADSLLSLGLLMQFVSVYYLFKSEGKPKWIWAFFGAFIFTFLAKSFAATFFLIGFTIYGLLFERHTFFGLFRRWQSYAGIVLTAAVVLGFFVLRDAAHPGYLKYTFGSHAGRLVKTIGEHGKPWDFFMRNFIRERYTWWIAPAALGILGAFVWKPKSLLNRLAALTVLAFLILISASASKLFWYDAPAYPLLAMIASGPIYLLLTAKQISAAGMIGVTAALFFFPIYDMIKKADSNYPGLNDREYEIKEYYLHQMFAKKKDPNGLVVLDDMFIGALLFYKHAFNERGQELNIQHGTADLEGKNVLTSHPDLKSELITNYSLDTVDHYHGAVVYHIKTKI